MLAMLLLAAAVIGNDPVKKPEAKNASPPKEAQDAVAAEYEKLLEKDEAGLEKIEKLMAEFEAFSTNGAPGSRAALFAKVDEVVDGVKRSYDGFLERNPKHVDGYLAYGSFLNELGDEEGATVKWEKARELDPKNPSAWNNLANVFGHIGPTKKAFQFYEKAIELDPKEPVYVQNLATTMYLYRKDAAEMYRIDEEGVFNKSLDLYRQAMKLDPTNIVLATEYAQSYYGIKPTRVEDAIAAWKHCLTLAKSDVEKQGIYLHLARVELNAGLFEEAQKHLDLVKDPNMDELKKRLQRNLDKKQKADGADAVADEKVKEVRSK